MTHQEPRTLLPVVRADVCLHPHAALLHLPLTAPVGAVTIGQSFCPPLQVLAEFCYQPPVSLHSATHSDHTNSPARGMQSQQGHRCHPAHRRPQGALGQFPAALPWATGIRLEAMYMRGEGDGTQGLIGSTQTLKQGAKGVSESAVCTWPEASNTLATTPTYQHQTTLQTACRQVLHKSKSLRQGEEPHAQSTGQ